MKFGHSIPLPHSITYACLGTISWRLNVPSQVTGYNGIELGLVVSGITVLNYLDSLDGET